jgi:hypothetical protein
MMILSEGGGGQTCWGLLSVAAEDVVGRHGCVAKAVEAAAGAACVRAHVVEAQPVAGQQLRQLRARRQLVDAVARGAEERRLEERAVGSLLVRAWGEQSWMDGGVVVDEAVE